MRSICLAGAAALISLSIPAQAASINMTMSGKPNPFEGHGVPTNAVVTATLSFNTAAASKTASFTWTNIVGTVNVSWSTPTASGTLLNLDLGANPSSGESFYQSRPGDVYDGFYLEYTGLGSVEGDVDGFSFDVRALQEDASGFEPTNLFNDADGTTPLDALVGNNLFDRDDFQYLDFSVGYLDTTPMSGPLINPTILRTTPNGDKSFSMAVAPVPLPAAAWLFASALGGIGLLSARQRRIQRS